MNPVAFIREKREGKKHRREDLEAFLLGYLRDEVPDYQVSAWLMAAFLRGLDPEETLWLTETMARSGKVLDLSGLPHPVDKHSSGGVGDKVSLVVGPILAASGCTFAKMSGRGLAHTGGTIDKLESVPGWRGEMTEAEFLERARRVGLVIAAQSPDLAPLDGKLYALRDVTATVESVPLIASSIMSKKLAAGARSIVLDVKVGRGAFMKTLEEARLLAKTMVAIGQGAGRRVRALLTSMEAPLGRAVGNAIEVREAIEALKGEGPGDLLEVALALEERDWVVPSYRESAMLLAKGLPIHTLILYWRAHPAGWRFPEGVRAVNPYIPIATQIPQAVGLALAGRYRGEDWVVATSIGDGGTSEGDFHEGLNFAAVFGAPVVFLVQNNGYAISVPKSRQMKVDYVARRAEGYGMPGVVVDGNDAFAVYLEAKKAVERARKGEGPTLLEALTYRLAPHTTSDDPSRYRSKEEEEAWRAKDPILRLRKALEGRGLWGEEAEKALLLELEEEFQRELALADEAPEPRPEEIVEHVYAEMGPDQRRAWEALRRGLHVEEVE